MKTAPNASMSERSQRSGGLAGTDTGVKRVAGTKFGARARRLGGVTTETGAAGAATTSGTLRGALFPFFGKATWVIRPKLSPERTLRYSPRFDLRMVPLAITVSPV